MRQPWVMRLTVALTIAMMAMLVCDAAPAVPEDHWAAEGIVSEDSNRARDLTDNAASQIEAGALLQEEPAPAEAPVENSAAPAAAGNATAAPAQQTQTENTVKNAGSEAKPKPEEEDKKEDKPAYSRAQADEDGILPPFDMPKVKVPTERETKHAIYEERPPSEHSANYWKLKKLKDQYAYEQGYRKMKRDLLRKYLARHYTSKLMKNHMRRTVNRLRRARALDEYGPGAHFKPFEWGKDLEDDGPEAPAATSSDIGDGDGDTTPEPAKQEAAGDSDGDGDGDAEDPLSKLGADDK